MRRMLIRPERIKLLEILQEVRTICKTRNQLMPHKSPVFIMKDSNSMLLVACC
jgi:hypothetical protein